MFQVVRVDEQLMLTPYIQENYSWPSLNAVEENA